jgi:hypothetical protein
VSDAGAALGATTVSASTDQAAAYIGLFGHGQVAPLRKMLGIGEAIGLKKKAGHRIETVL